MKAFDRHLLAIWGTWLVAMAGFVLVTSPIAAVFLIGNEFVFSEYFGALGEVAATLFLISVFCMCPAGLVCEQLM